MNCSKCGKEIKDNSKYCTYCGTELSTNQLKVSSNSDSTKKNISTGKVIIRGYEEFYLINVKIDVLENGRLITSISKGETFEYSISETTTLTFKCGIRNTQVTVQPNAITEIQLIFNRATGVLETVCNVQTDDEKLNYTNRLNYQSQLNEKKKSSNVWLIVGGICLLIFILLMLNK